MRIILVLTLVAVIAGALMASAEDQSKCKDGDTCILLHLESAIATLDGVSPDSTSFCKAYRKMLGNSMNCQEGALWHAGKIIGTLSLHKKDLSKKSQKKLENLKKRYERAEEKADKKPYEVRLK